MRTNYVTTILTDARQHILLIKQDGKPSSNVSGAVLTNFRVSLIPRFPFKSLASLREDPPSQTRFSIFTPCRYDDREAAQQKPERNDNDVHLRYAMPAFFALATARKKCQNKNCTMFPGRSGNGRRTCYRTKGRRSFGWLALNKIRWDSVFFPDFRERMHYSLPTARLHSFPIFGKE